MMSVAQTVWHKVVMLEHTILNYSWKQQQFKGASGLLSCDINLQCCVCVHRLISKYGHIHVQDRCSRPAGCTEQLTFAHSQLLRYSYV